MSDIPSISAATLMSTITTHNFERGGTQTLITGTQGSGKTTGLIHLAKGFCFVDPETGNLIRETVIWRGRDVDYWMSFEPSECVVHVSTYDYPVFKVYDLSHKILDITGYNVLKYGSTKELMQNINLSKINVVYEPTNYTISKKLRKIIPNISSGKLRHQLGMISPYVWWYEFFHYVLKHKPNTHLSIIIDEGGELFPARVESLNWWLVNWFKNNFIDFRKRNISFLIAAHSHVLIYPEILPLFQYFIYMRGSTPISKSMVHYRSPVMQDVGSYHVDGGLWGKGGFADLPNKKQHLVRFEHPDPEDEEEEEEVEKKPRIYHRLPDDVRARVRDEYAGIPAYACAHIDTDIGRVE